LVGGIQAASLSSVVASSISSPGANSDVKCFHVLAAPYKKLPANPSNEELQVKVSKQQ